MPSHHRQICAGLILCLSPLMATAQPAGSRPLIENWVGCLKGTAVSYALINRDEPAETIATAAVGHCAADEEKLRSALLRKMTVQLADETIRKSLANLRPRLIDSILHVRATGSK